MGLNRYFSMKKGRKRVLILGFLPFALLYLFILFQSARREQASALALARVKSAILTERLQQARQFYRNRGHAGEKPVATLSFDATGAVHSSRNVPAAEVEGIRALAAPAAQGKQVVELIAFNGAPHWLIAEPAGRAEPGGIACRTRISREWPLERELGLHALFGEHEVFAVLRETWLPRGEMDAAARAGLPQQAFATLFERESSWQGVVRLPAGWKQITAIPVKDTDAWEVIGAVFVAETAPPAGRLAARAAASLPGLAGAVVLGFCAWLVLHGLLPVFVRKAQREPDGRATTGVPKKLLWIAVLLLTAWVLLGLRRAQAGRVEARQQLVRLAAYTAAAPVVRAAQTRAKFALDGVWVEFAAWQGGTAALALAIVFLASVVAKYHQRPVKLKQLLAGYGFVLPAGLHLLLFSLGPILFALFISFHAWSILSPERPFVGLGNYREVVTSREFWNSLKNTALYVLHVPAGMLVSLGLALLLNRSRMPGLGLLRTIFYLPSITSFVAIALVWQWIYNPDFGLFNYALSLLGLGPLPWLHDPATALLSLMLMAIWIQAGYQMVIFLAGLQNIPAYLYEAARIDGAGPWQRFVHITLPQLRPTTFFILVTSVIGSFQVFTQIYVMTEGGPLQATEVIVYYIYKNAWDYLRMGYASAMSFILFAIILLLTLLQFRLMGRREAWES